MTSKYRFGDRGEKRVLGALPMASMREAIIELRAWGHNALADDLTRLRDQWAQTVLRHVDAGDALEFAQARRVVRMLAAGERR